MHSDDLEEVMTRFVNGEADVLLSTTIIESGLDIRTRTRSSLTTPTVSA